MPGHDVYGRTITATGKSITKASSSLLDFSSRFPHAGGNPSSLRQSRSSARARRAPAPPSPGAAVAPLLPLPSATSTPPRRAGRRRRRPFPASFLPGRLSAVASAAHPSPNPRLLTAGRLPSPAPEPSGAASRGSHLWTPPAPVPSPPQLMSWVRASAHLVPLSVAPWLPSPSRFAHRTLPGLRSQSPWRARRHLLACPIRAFTVRLRSPALARTRLPTLRGASRELRAWRSEFWGKGVREQPDLLAETLR